LTQQDTQRDTASRFTLDGTQYSKTHVLFSSCSCIGVGGALKFSSVQFSLLIPCSSYIMTEW